MKRLTARLKDSFFLQIAICCLFLICNSCSEDKDILTELSISNQLEVFTSNGGIQSISFSTNKDWTIRVQDNAQWCSVSPTQGKAGSNTINIKVNANEDPNSRSLNLLLTAGEDKTQEILITQKQKDALILTQSEYNISQESSTIQVEVKSNADCIIEIPQQSQDWIHLKDNSRGITTTTFSFLIDKSKEYEKREGQIIFKVGKLSETIKIIQEGQAILQPVQKEYTVTDKGETIIVEVNSNFNFEIQMPNVDWITNTTPRSVSKHTLYYKIAPNTTFDSRKADIILFDKNGNTKEIIAIIQSPLALLIEETECQLGEGNSKQLTYKINPDLKNSISWSSSDEKIVTVSLDGKVTAIKKGEAVITLATKDGIYSATCNVTVKAISDYITFSISSSTIAIGGYINKSVSSTITNKSNSIVQLLKLTVKHPYTQKIISSTTDESLLGELAPEKSVTLSINNLREDIIPIFIWEYLFEGNKYVNYEKIGGADSNTPDATADDIPWN